MLVICCGMPLSGSTVQFQIASELVERLGVGRRVPGYGGPAPEEALRELAPVSVIKSHQPIPLPGGPDGPYVRYLYSYRDVRDALASWLLKRGDEDAPDLGDVTRDEMLGPFRYFTARRRVLTSRYEDFVDDLRSEVRRIGDFLELDAADELVGRIADELSLSAQRRFIDAKRWSDGEAFDQHTLLHRSHIRDGRPGRYRERLNEEQLAAIEGAAGEWLDEMGYPPSRPVAAAAGQGTVNRATNPRHSEFNASGSGET